MKLGKGFMNLQGDVNAIASGGPWYLGPYQLGFKDRGRRPWQVRGSNKQLPDPRIPALSPQWAPQVAQGGTQRDKYSMTLLRLS